MKNTLKILAVILSISLIQSCKKDKVPTLTTEIISNIGMNQASSGGTITDDGNAEVVDRGVCWNNVELPTIANSKTHDGTGLGFFESTMTQLTSNTKYYARAYATNSKGTAYGEQVSFITKSDIVFNPDLTYGTISDIVGNEYKTIQIGSQVWMAENLKTSKFNDGTDIPLVTDNTAWGNLTTPGYGWYNNDITYKASYGALYNWYAVNTGKLCPSGWHIPSDAEWHQLVLFLDPNAVLTMDESINAGGMLKETGSTHWVSPNVGATNSSGFTGLPGGVIGIYGYYWALTEYDAENGLIRDLDTGDSKIRRSYSPKTSGLSVRCIKD